MARTHVVLVPGFGGFDALGQIYYYAGTGASFEDWRKKNREAAGRLCLHYFENLPTAGVQSRAMALREYVQERVYRCVIQDGDRIALVGHSTGGLDIRQLLMDLHERKWDGMPSLVPDSDILNKVKRLVFMSVPQFGTNIADFARRQRLLIQTGALAARTYLEKTHGREKHGRTPDPNTTPDLFDAVHDAVEETRETGDTATALGRYKNALSRAAYGELIGWLDNVGNDFFATEDLTARPDPGQLRTPAHYDSAQREAELAFWRAKEQDIRTLSFATVGKPPYDKLPGSDHLLSLLGSLLKGKDSGTDIVYRFVYGATAVGPFEVAAGYDTVKDGSGSRKLDAWENDGIVNTASMLWPDGEETRLVRGDHGDIIGHYTGQLAVKQSEKVLERTNHTYDLLDSESGFKKADFDKVWHEIFDFCARDA